MPTSDAFSTPILPKPLRSFSDFKKGVNNGASNSQYEDGREKSGAGQVIREASKQKKVDAG